MNVYSLMVDQDSEGGVAKAPLGWWPPTFGDVELLPNWATPTFKLSGRWVDLQPNDVGAKLFSRRMRGLLAKHKALADRVEWLPVRIESHQDVQEFAILHLLDEIDVIDRERSVLNRVTGGVIKAHLRVDAIGEHRLFTYSRSTGGIILVTDVVFDALRSCSGCSFAKIKVGS